MNDFPTPESVLAEQGDLESNRQRMLSFIESKGGKINFAEFVKEHLYGPNGYYASRVQIGESIEHPKDFTTLASFPVFARLMFEYARSRHLNGRDFLELGGGPGFFKRNYLSQDPDVNYVSVDISPHLATIQAQEGINAHTADRTEVASATNLNFLEDKSVNGIIFANELLDAFPPRLIGSKIERGKIETIFEFVVKAKDGKIGHDFEALTVDDLASDYFDYISQGQRLKGIDGLVLFSLPVGVDQLIRELDRVLNHGRIVLSDYGFTRFSSLKQDELTKGPYFLENDPAGGKLKNAKNWPYALEKPYATDFTYLVDFAYVARLFRRQNQSLRVTTMPQEELFSGQKADPLAPGMQDYQTILKAGGGHFMVLEAIKQ
jgi:SAM-dependent MidA family methyltransferase